MRNLIRAYKEGFEGGETSPLRLRKVAYKLGEVARGRFDADNSRLKAQMDARLDIAISESHQLNSKSLEIIKYCDKLIDTGDPFPSTSISRLASIKNPTPINYEWIVGLRHGVDKDQSRKYKLPLYDKLPVLKIDQDEIEVDNISMHVQTPVIDGVIQPASTEIWINSRPYDPLEVLDKPFLGGVKIHIDADGTTLFGRTTSLSTGYKTIAPSHTNVASFLDGVYDCVQRTAQAYEDIGNASNFGE